jgi:hypothetical protein
MGETKGKDRPTERILRQTLLHHLGKPYHAFAYIDHTAGQIDPGSGRQSDHGPRNTSSTRRNALTFTWASTRSETPSGKMLSISPSDRVGSAQ